MTIPGRNRSTATGFEQRAERAELLASTGTCDAEPLNFCAGLLRTQASVASALEAEHAALPLTGRLGKDVERILRTVLEVPRYVARHGPEALAEDARVRAMEDADTARMRLTLYWSDGRKATEDYLSRAMLRPYLEVLRVHGLALDRVLATGRCPYCGGGPAVGALRGGSEGQGAERRLVCAPCGNEWPIHRILCPACGERDPAKLPCFSSSSYPAVRLEACMSCSRYVKSFDLSLDARPIPEVDDLASLALDLRAREQGITRLEPGLAGI